MLKYENVLTDCVCMAQKELDHQNQGFRLKLCLLDTIDLAQYFCSGATVGYGRPTHILNLNTRK